MKSEVYSWRLSSELKGALEEVARERGVTVAALLEGLAREFLARADDRDETEKQQALRESTRALFGTISGGDPDRASRARETVRKRLRKKRSVSGAG